MKPGMTDKTLFLNRGDRRLSASGPMFMIRARRDFLRAQSKGLKRVTPGFVLHIFVRHNAGLPVTAVPRAGFTASKKSRRRCSAQPRKTSDARIDARYHSA